MSTTPEPTQPQLSHQLASMQKELERLQGVEQRNKALQEQVRLYQAAQEAQARSLRIIGAIADTFYRSLSFKDIVERAVSAIITYSHYPSVAIFSLQPPQEQLELISARGFGDETLRRSAHLPLHGTLTGLCVQRKEIVISTDLRTDNRLSPTVQEALAREGYVTTICVPLLFQEQVLGAMNLIYKEEASPTQEELETLRTLGKTIGLAMANARYVSQIKAEIAERQRAEEELRKFKFVVDHAGEEFYLVRPDGRFSYVNEAAARSLGYGIKQMLSKTLYAIAVNYTLEDFHQSFDQVKKGPAVLFEMSHRASDGQVRIKEMTAFYVCIGEHEYLCGFGRDITERKRQEAERHQLEQQLRQTQKIESLGVLAGGLAHDFNNLLTGIIGNLSLAQTRLDPTSRVMRYLQEAERASMRARDLTQQLLTFSRGGAPLTKVAPIQDIIREATGFALSGSNVRCEFDLAQDLWPAEIDSAQINQAIQNLIINSKEAMPQGGAVHIHADNFHYETGRLPLSPGDYIRIMIIDNGIGIPEAYVEKIFDPYFSTKREGSGLGLTTAYSIVKRHRGHIMVASEPGLGTTFTLFLPSAPIPEPPRPSLLHPPQAPRRVLVMDDEDFIRDLAEAMLVELGFEVETCAGGEDTIERYKIALERSAPFDLVILDLTIPGGMGGKEVVAQLKELHPAVRAIVSSGYSNDPIMAEYQRYGFCSVLAKPYPLEQLRQVVDEVLQQS